MVSIHRNHRLICSGGIIDDWHVISAAHCFVDGTTNLFLDSRITIVVGTNDLNVNVKAACQVTADQIFIPSIYNGKVWNQDEIPVGDIALIKVILRSINYNIHNHIFKYTNYCIENVFC